MFRRKNNKVTVIEKHILTDISSVVKYVSDDKLAILLRDKFFEYTGKLPTETLSTFNEKIIWSGMFDVTPLKIMCADKYTVRQYVSDTIGEKYLINLVHQFDNLNDFDLSILPNKFVLKYSEGSGKVLLCQDKNSLNLEYIKSVMRGWVIDEFWLHYFEMQYKESAKKFIVEDFIDTKIEYKLWMFHGKCQFIKIEIMNEFAENGKPNNQYGKYFTPDWLPTDFKTVGQEPNFEIKKPKRLQELLSCAEKLSAPFDFVRVDFFETNDGELKFGELTFTPAAGRVHFMPEDKNLEFGKWIKMPERDNQGFAIR